MSASQSAAEEGGATRLDTLRARNIDTTGILLADDPEQARLLHFSLQLLVKLPVLV
jgi:hypothetical protein